MGIILTTLERIVINNRLDLMGREAKRGGQDVLLLSRSELRQRRNVREALDIDAWSRLHDDSPLYIYLHELSKSAPELADEASEITLKQALKEPLEQDEVVRARNAIQLGKHLAVDFPLDKDLADWLRGVLDADEQITAGGDEILAIIDKLSELSVELKSVGHAA